MTEFWVVMIWKTVLILLLIGIMCYMMDRVGRNIK